MNLIQKFKDWHLEQAELALADAEEDYAKWRFAMKPSEARRQQKIIERRRKTVERLRGKELE